MRRFDWKRFWHPQGLNPTYDGRGYLLDPGDDTQRTFNRKLVTFDNIPDTSCLILLGEPGAGKTYAMEKESELVKQALPPNEEFIKLNLHSFRDEARLEEKLFKSTEFSSWFKGSGRLHVWLDSFDECLIRVETLIAFVTDELRELPLDRLLLRIACRSGSWPVSLETNLKNLWGEEHVKAYELAPLRCKDIEQAAEAQGINSQNFLRCVEGSRSVPLAIRPVTLNMLLKTYERQRVFPAGQHDLYESACLALCDEPNPERRDSGLLPAFSPEQLFAAARRIAAALLFSNRAAVWTGPYDASIAGTHVLMSDLYGGRETIGDQSVEVEHNICAATLGTALFKIGADEHTREFFHQTIAEFLAARYLQERGIPPEQQLSLMVHPADPESRIIPQLHGTAGWVAAMEPAVFDAIVAQDPEVLLYSNCTSVSENSRQKLVGRLLECYDTETLLDSDWGLRSNYQLLKHQGLGKQVSSYITDTSKGIVVRRVAVEIAVECELQELEDELVRIALDATDDHHIRTEAAFAVSLIGSERAKTGLRRLIGASSADEPNDELKGIALSALWPEHLTAQEVFDAFTLPKHEHFVDHYYMFVAQSLSEHIQPSDLPIALDWIAAHVKEFHQDSFPFEEMMAKIVALAWDDLDVPDVLISFAEAAAIQFVHLHQLITERRGGSDLREQIAREPSKRRRVTAHILPLLTDEETKSSIFYGVLGTFLFSDDVPWLLERLEQEDDSDIQECVARFIRHKFNPSQPANLDAVLALYEHNEALRTEFRNLVEPVRLNSPEVEKLKKQWQENIERETETPLIDPPPTERIRIRLEAIETGELNAWWWLNRELTLKPTSMRYGQVSTDLRTLPGWQEASASERQRIISAGLKFVRDYVPSEGDDWLGSGSLKASMVAGLRALMLLLHETPERLAELPPETWAKWAGIIVDYPHFIGEDIGTDQTRLLRLAYEKNPSRVVDVVLRIIEGENERSDHCFVLDKVQSIVDSTLQAALLARIMASPLKPLVFRRILKELVSRSNTEACEYAASLVPARSADDKGARERAVAAAAILLQHARDDGWSVVWPALTSDPEFGRAVIENAAHDLHLTVAYLKRISPIQAAELYIWLAEQYPYSEDKLIEGTHYMGTREFIADIKRDILGYLKQCGTSDALRALESIKERFPEHDHLKWIIFEAKKHVLRETWVAPEPREVLQRLRSRNVEVLKNHVATSQRTEGQEEAFREAMSYIEGLISSEQGDQ